MNKESLTDSSGKPLHRGFSFCSIPSASPERPLYPQPELAPLGLTYPRLVSGTRTPGEGASPDAAGWGETLDNLGIVFATIFQ